MADTQRPLTLLHLSDTQFGRHHRFGGLDLPPPDNSFDTLLVRLIDDLTRLRQDDQLQPDVVVVSGDLAEWGMQSEFASLMTFLNGLLDFLKLRRDRVVLVPGNHDINRNACEAFFHACAADAKTPQPPFWPKWRHYVNFFKRFYRDHRAVAFTRERPWTFYEMADLKLVVAGLNSTMRESHRDEDHYGWVGEAQLRWFADRLDLYKTQGWLRIGVVHHNVRRGPTSDDENLRDAEDLRRILGDTDRVNLLLHGHTHDGKLDWLNQRVPILATGSAAVKQVARPEEVPNQYQIVQLWPHGFRRWTRSYAPDRKGWIGDTRASSTGNDWRDAQSVEFLDVAATFTG